jgi:outer membrane protein assembly factor BamB
VYSSPAIGSDGTVYVGSRDHKLYAINGKSGVKLWEFETGGYVQSSPAIGSDGTVYVGSDDGRLYAINGQSGVKLWEFKTEGKLFSSPAIGSDGTVYVGATDKMLYAIDGNKLDEFYVNGIKHLRPTKLWEFETGGPVGSSPAIGSDGTVYVGSRDHKLYAIKTDSKGLANSPWPMLRQNPLHTGRTK